MNHEVLEIVINEILDQHKESAILNEEILKRIKNGDNWVMQVLNQQMATMENQRQLLLRIEEKLNTISKETKASAKPVVQQRIFQLFPSFNIREYYQIYGNIFKWFALFGMACLVIRLIRDLLTVHGYL